MRLSDRIAGVSSQVITVVLYGLFLALFFYFPSNLKVGLEAQEFGYPIAYFIFLALNLALYFAVGFVNPGYVHMMDSEAGIMLEDQDHMSREMDDDMQGDEEQARTGTRHCAVCKVDQALRTRHCRKCQRCVGRFDHHCFLINNCVGEGNATLFWWYLLVQSIVSLWTLKLTASCLTEQSSITLWFQVNALPLVALLVIIGFTVVPLGLLVLHTFLALTAQTTWEMMSRKKISYLKDFPAWAYPFSQGVMRNLRVFCCMLPAMSGKWTVPDAAGDQHRISLFSSRHHDCC